MIKLGTRLLARNVVVIHSHHAAMPCADGRGAAAAAPDAARHEHGVPGGGGSRLWQPGECQRAVLHLSQQCAQLFAVISVQKTMSTPTILAAASSQLRSQVCFAAPCAPPTGLRQPERHPAPRRLPGGTAARVHPGPQRQRGRQAGKRQRCLPHGGWGEDDVGGQPAKCMAGGVIAQRWTSHWCCLPAQHCPLSLQLLPPCLQAAARALSNLVCSDTTVQVSSGWVVMRADGQPGWEVVCSMWLLGCP